MEKDICIERKKEVKKYIRKEGNKERRRKTIRNGEEKCEEQGMI